MRRRDVLGAGYHRVVTLMHSYSHETVVIVVGSTVVGSIVVGLTGVGSVAFSRIGAMRAMVEASHRKNVLSRLGYSPVRVVP